MPSAASGYGPLLRTPGAAAFFLAAALGRVGIAMTGLGLVWLVHARTGSYGTAGQTAAAFALAEALIGPQVARLTDRFGQTRVLPWALLVHGAAIVGVLSAPSPAALVAAATCAGAAVPQLGALSSARWVSLLREKRADDLPIAFSLESLANATGFLVGPVLVTALGAAGETPLATALAATLILAGGGALAAQHRTAPVPVRAPSRLPEPKPASVTEHGPGPASGPLVVPEPEPGHGPGSGPLVVPEPVRAPALGPSSQAVPVPRTEPLPAAESGAGSGPRHGPAPNPVPGLAPDPLPAPAPGPEVGPRHEPAPAPVPGPRSVPVPGPGLASDPLPAPAPGPEVGPRPELAISSDSAPGPQPGPEPSPGRSVAGNPGPARGLLGPDFLLVALLNLAIGLYFGTMSVGVSAFAVGHGLPAAAAPITGAASLAGLLSGWFYGLRRHRMPVQRQLLATTAYMTAASLLLPLAPSVFWLAAAVMVTEAAVPPTLVLLNVLTERSVAPAVLTQAFTWNNSTSAAGSALSAWLAGRTADAHGASAAFALAPAAGLVLLTLAAGTARRRQKASAG